MPQPPPRLIDRLGNITAQLRRQPRDQHRVLLIESYRTSGPRSAATTTSPAAARTRTACPGRRPAGPAPATGARSAHTTPSPPPHLAAAAGLRPSPAPRRDPRPGTERPPGDHLRVVIGRHDHLLDARQVDPGDRFDTGTQARSRSSRALRLRSPRDTPLPLPMNVLLLVGTPSPKRIGDVPTSRTDTQTSLCRGCGSGRRSQPSRRCCISSAAGGGSSDRDQVTHENQRLARCGDASRATLAIGQSAE